MSAIMGTMEAFSRCAPLAGAQAGESRLDDSRKGVARMQQFKTESKKLLDLMINSIYTNKEIFLRELISNASDAVDKLNFRSLSDSSVQLESDDLAIRVSFDKDARMLTVSDNGIGMTAEDLEENLGTIAHSGSQEFKQENAEHQGGDVDIIGQFGVGFYSAFMVASKVRVVSRAFGEDTAHVWESDGLEATPSSPASAPSTAPTSSSPSARTSPARMASPARTTTRIFPSGGSRTSSSATATTCSIPSR